MKDLRAIKRKGRRTLHDKLKLPLVLVLSDGGAFPFYGRIHRDFAPVGGVRGLPYPPAQLHSESARVVLREAETPANDPTGPTIAQSFVRGALISVLPGEAYNLEQSLESDDEFITWEISRVSAAEAAGLPVPDSVFSNLAQPLSGVLELDPNTDNPDTLALLSGDQASITGEDSFILVSGDQASTGGT